MSQGEDVTSGRCLKGKMLQEENVSKETPVDFHMKSKELVHQSAEMDFSADISRAVFAPSSILGWAYRSQSKNIPQ